MADQNETTDTPVVNKNEATDSTPKANAHKEQPSQKSKGLSETGEMEEYFLFFC